MRGGVHTWPRGIEANTPNVVSDPLTPNGIPSCPLPRSVSPSRPPRPRTAHISFRSNLPTPHPRLPPTPTPPHMEALRRRLSKGVSFKEEEPNSGEGGGVAGGSGGGKLTREVMGSLRSLTKAGEPKLDFRPKSSRESVPSPATPPSPSPSHAADLMVGSLPTERKAPGGALVGEVEWIPDPETQGYRAIVKPTRKSADDSAGGGSGQSPPPNARPTSVAPPVPSRSLKPTLSATAAAAAQPLDGAADDGAEEVPLSQAHLDAMRAIEAAVRREQEALERIRAAKRGVT